MKGVEANLCFESAGHPKLGFFFLWFFPFLCFLCLKPRKKNNKIPKLTPTSQQKSPNKLLLQACRSTHAGGGTGPSSWPGSFSMQCGHTCQGIPKPAPVSAPFWKHRGQRKGGRSEGCPCRVFLLCVPAHLGVPWVTCVTCVTSVTSLVLVGPRCCFPRSVCPGCAGMWFLDPPMRNRLWWPRGLTALGKG